ncbi:MAG: substrate-binding domain-containing protein, partial [Victivallales bacterium]|nr:substrate-binding domain-containing protein [Victivallales bacterium]
PCLGVLKALHENNVKIPSELSIVSIGEIGNSAFYYPALTTVSTSLELQMAESITSIRDIVNGEIKPPVKKCLKAEIKILESSGIAPQK